MSHNSFRKRVKLEFMFRNCAIIKMEFRRKCILTPLPDKDMFQVHIKQKKTAFQLLNAVLSRTENVLLLLNARPLKHLLDDSMIKNTISLVKN